MISQTIIHLIKKCKRGEGNAVKNGVGPTVVVAFTITEISYLAVDLLNDLVSLLLFIYL